MTASKLCAVVGASFLLLAAVPQVQAQSQAAGAPQYQVGNRLAAPAGSASGPFRELSWDELMPADWKPEALFADINLDELGDNDPRAMEVLQRIREEWDRAPVVERLAGERVRIPGFLVPLETNGEQISEFLLVPYFGACVHVPPPPANQLIHVIPDKAVPAGYNMLPVWVEGVMAVGRIDSDMGVAGYQLRGMKVEEYIDTEPLPD